MTPARYDITIYQGTTYSRTFAFRQANGTTPIDLTGYEARMQIRESVDSETVLLELTTEPANGRLTINGAAGTVAALVSATDTSAIAWTEGVYDLELVDGLNVSRPLYGKVRVSPEVTR
jgi:hypothetical protein